MRKILAFVSCFFSFFLQAQEYNYFVNSIGDTLPTGVPIKVTGRQLNGSTIQPPKITVAKTPKKVKAYHNKIVAGAPTVIEMDTAKVQKIVFGTKNWPAPTTIELPKVVVPASQPIPTTMQPPSFKDIATQDIRYLDVEHGLTSSYHFSVFEDSRGYFWFSSWDIGVGRYDGYSLRSFTTKEGLINNRVLTIFEDSKGYLWFGTAYGLSRYDGQQFVNYEIPDEIFTIFEDSQGRIWIGTGISGAGYFNEQGDFVRLTTEHGLPTNNVTAILEDQAGSIWLAGNGGIIKYEERGLTIYPIQHDLECNFLFAMCLDQQGSIWVSTENGVGHFDGKILKKYTEAQGLSHNIVFDVMTDRKGDIWFGTRRGGACKFDGTHFTHYQTQEGLSFVEVMSLFEDSRGQIWMVTYGAGINILNPYSFQNFSTSEGLSHNVVNHIMEDKQGNLWMSTEGKGVLKYDGTFYHYYTTQTGMVTDEIAYTFEDNQGNIWLSTFIEGAIKYDGQFFTHYGAAQGLLADNIGAIVEDPQGNIWFSSEGNDGLFQFDGQHFTQFSITEGLLDNNLQDLTIDQQGNLWIAGNVGLTKYDGTYFTHYTEQETGIRGGIKSIMYDEAKTIWLGTYVDGVAKFDGQQFTFIQDKLVLPPNILMAFTTDDQNNTWLGTENGLFFLEASETNTPQFISFQRSDGIRGKDLRHRALCVDAQQQLWIGTGKSLSKLDLPTFYQERKTPIPRVQLNHILINEIFYDFSKTDSPMAKLAAVNIEFREKSPYQNIPTNLAVPYDQNHLTFDFIAIDPVAPHKIEYQYQMDNLTNDWSRPTKEHRIDYRSLSFGEHTFKVRARSATGKWSQPTTFSFTIRPPWWHTNLAYFGYFGAFLALIYGIYLFIQRQLALRNKLHLEQLEAARLKELDSFKTKLYTNLTHEFRTPLTVIMGMANQIHSEPKKFLTEGIQLIQRNSQNLLRLINQLLDLSKLENNAFQLNYQQADIIPYLQYLTESFHSLANGKNLSLRFFSNVEHLIMDYDAEQIKQVITNLISNAIKFTESGGNIMVRLTQQDGQLTIEVEDNGIGIAPKDIPHLFDRFFQVDGSVTRKEEGTGIGLSHTKELVKLMDGTIRVKSNLGQGSSFFVQLPIRNTATIVREVAAISDFKDHKTDNILAKKKDNLEKIAVSPPIKNSDLPQLLIIEDNPDVVIYLKSCLADLYQIEVAYNGRIGIEKALENIPDLIISDVMMPEKDGFEVCDVLKKEERTSHIPFILLTAKADISSKIAGLKRGADAYLAKPFDKEELLVRLAALVKKQAQLRQYFGNLASVKSEPNFPLAAAEKTVIQTENAFLLKVNTILEKHYTDHTFGLPQLCQKVGMSRSQLFRKMKALIDVAPSAYIRSYRLNKAKNLLATTEMNVSEVAWATGFVNLAHFSKVFQDEFGVAPSATNK